MASAREIDLEMLYVECSVCGQPILWEKGVTTGVVLNSGIDVAQVDWECLILSEGCPACTPGQTVFSTQLVRLDPGDGGLFTPEARS